MKNEKYAVLLVVHWNLVFGELSVAQSELAKHFSLIFYKNFAKNLENSLSFKVDLPNYGYYDNPQKYVCKYIEINT